MQFFRCQNSPGFFDRTPPVGSPCASYHSHSLEEATKVREAALQPRTHEGLSKFVVAVLKAVLEARGLETSGNKAALVARLLAALVPQSS